MNGRRKDDQWRGSKTGRGKKHWKLASQRSKKERLVSKRRSNDKERKGMNGRGRGLLLIIKTKWPMSAKSL